MNQLASSQAQKHKLGWTVATCCTREHLGYLGLPTRHSVEQDAGMARSPGPGRNPGGQDLDHRAASARSWSFVVGVDHLHLLTGKLIQNSRGSPAPVHAVVGAPCASPHHGLFLLISGFWMKISEKSIQIFDYFSILWTAPY